MEGNAPGEEDVNAFITCILEYILSVPSGLCQSPGFCPHPRHLKNEMFYNRSWEGCSIAELKYEIDSYIRWYCTDRIKSTLGGLSPLQYRKELGMAV